MVKDKNGGTCEKGDVIVTRDNETNDYQYTLCLKCEEYESEDAICQGNYPGSVIVNSHTELGNKKVFELNYDSLKYIGADYYQDCIFVLKPNADATKEIVFYFNYNKLGVDEKLDTSFTINSSEK